MTVGEVPPPDFAARLRTPGVCLRTGAFVVHVETPLPALARAIQFFYHDFPFFAPGAGVADFHVRIVQPRGLRRWLRPQVFLVLDGELPFAPLPLKLAFPMLEWCLNWCAAEEAHHYILVHSAVVEREGRALILAGMPAAGKSTLCAGLVNRGWRLLSDEFALLRSPDGRLMPWPRPVGLKEGSIRVIRDFAPGAVIGPAVRDKEKGLVAHMRPPTGSVARAEEPATPAWVVFPTYQPGASTKLEPMPRARAFFRLADNSFNQAAMGLFAFRALSGVIDACDAYDFTYSDLDEAVALFTGLAPPRARSSRGP